MTRVTCVGLAVQDLVFGVGEPLIHGEKNFADSLYAVGGGPAANAAVAIACLGSHASLITAVGRDAIGEEIVGELEGFGVDCTGVRRVDHPSPLSAVVIGPDGDRTIVNRTDPELWSEARPPTLADLDGSDAILVDVRWPEGALSASTIARQLGIPLVVDCDLTDGEVSMELLASASHTVFSQPAFERMYRTTTVASVERARTELGGFVAVTMGSAGVVWAGDAGVRTTKAFEVEVVDTLGAGDVFHGAFAVGVAEGVPDDDIVRWSSAAAAVKCSRLGGRSGFPSRVDVAAYLEENAS